VVASCDLLANLPGRGEANPLGFTPPSVTFEGATLVQAPSQQRLEAYYCPEVVPSPFGLPGGSGMLCQGFFGPRPSPAEMAVAFELRFRLKNPNAVPIPLGAVLAAVTVFPASANQRLGATCVQLCPAGQPTCSGQPGPGACEASSRDVRSLSDFTAAAANLIIAEGIAAGAGQPPSFAAPELASSGDVETGIRFSFGPEQLLATMRQLAEQSVDELKAGRAISFSIPYRVEGTIFFDAGSLGRIGVPYGPLEGTFVLPVEGVLSR
jgi:hypothetical protein